MISFKLIASRSGANPNAIIYREFFTVTQAESSGLEKPRESVVCGYVDDSIVADFPAEYAKFKALVDSDGDNLRAAALAELDK